MGKRPTPKQRHPHSRSGNRYGSYLRAEWRRLRGRAVSPFARPARKKRGKTATPGEKITTIKA